MSNDSPKPTTYISPRQQAKDRIFKQITESATASECILWDFQVVYLKKTLVMQIYIDKDQGVDLQDCEQVSRLLKRTLVDEDLMLAYGYQDYTLEISSPGIRRKLTQIWHYQICIGANLTVRFKQKLPQGRKFNGELIEVNEGKLKLLLTSTKNTALAEDKDTELCFELQELAGATLDTENWFQVHSLTELLKQNSL